mgnify:CR=1 FL=1
MIANTDIERGAITATKLSKNLRLPLANITAGESGQVLIGQANGDLAYKPVTGAVTIDSDGLTEVAATTDSVSEGTANLYYTDSRVDARILALRTGDSQLATTTESGFMPREDKAKVDATPIPSSTVRKYTTIITGTAATEAATNNVFEVTHDLRTYYVFVSVRHPAKPYTPSSSVSSVADKFHEDWYTQMDGGLDGQTGFQVATVDASYSLSKHKVLLNFPVGMVEDDEYLVTVIG